MTITYCGDGPWGTGKGSVLDQPEFDGNIYDLDRRVTEIEDNPPEPNNISNITLVGTQLTIYLEDATVFGPFTVPQASFRPSIVSTVTGTTYTPVIGDANGYKRCTNEAGCAVTIPLNSEVAFAVDTEITFRQVGANPITFDVATDGPTLNGLLGFLNETAFQGATVTIKKVATDEWDIIGLLAEDVTA